MVTTFRGVRSTRHYCCHKLKPASTHSQSVTTHPAVTTQSAQADYESQAEDIEGEPLIQEPTQQFDEPACKKKLVRLMDEQEEAMAEWLKVNIILYNKEKKEYCDVDKKGALWAAQV